MTCKVCDKPKAPKKPPKRDFLFNEFCFGHQPKDDKCVDCGFPKTSDHACVRVIGGAGGGGKDDKCERCEGRGHIPCAYSGAGAGRTPCPDCPKDDSVEA